MSDCFEKPVFTMIKLTDSLNLDEMKSQAQNRKTGINIAILRGFCLIVPISRAAIFSVS